MKKSILLLFVVFLIGCSMNNAETDFLLESFDAILYENEAYLDEVDYISIFINEDNVPDNLLLFLQKSLKERYDKKVYTYKKEEVHVSGPYGKESLDDDGIFLYIMDIDIDGDKTYVTGEKHYTKKNHPSVITTFIFE